MLFCFVVHLFIVEFIVYVLCVRVIVVAISKKEEDDKKILHLNNHHPSSFFCCCCNSFVAKPRLPTQSPSAVHDLVYYSLSPQSLGAIFGARKWKMLAIFRAERAVDRPLLQEIVNGEKIKIM